MGARARIGAGEAAQAVGRSMAEVKGIAPTQA
jgi:hypothetical protein